MNDSVPNLEDFIPSEELVHLADHRNGDVLQLLNQLGYLQAEAYSKNPGYAIHSAIAQYRKECQVHLSSSSVSVGFLPHDTLSTLEIQHLTQLLSLEGEYSLKQVPDVGKTGLATRILHFRLEILGLYTGQVADAVSENTFAAIEKLSVYLQLEGNVQAVLQLSGNIPLLCTHLLETQSVGDPAVGSPADQTQLVFFHFPEERLYKPYSLRPEFLTRLRRTVSRRSDTFQWFRKDIARVQENRRPTDQIQLFAENPLNSFLLRLLQVRQWINGYYEGELDQQIGALTFESILDFFRLEIESGKVDLPGFREFVAHLKDGYWVFNIRYFFDLLFEDDREESIAPEVIYAQLTGHLTQLEQQRLAPQPSKEQESDAFREQLQSVWNEVGRELRSNTEHQLATGKPVVRRIYFGITGFFRQVGKKIQIFFRWIADKLKKALTFFKNLIRYLYQEIQEAIYMLKDGLQFLISGRSITSLASDSQCLMHAEIQFGADALLILPAKITREQASYISEYMLNGAKGLNAMLSFTGGVIRWLLRLSSPIGWVQFAIRLAIFFREWLRGHVPPEFLSTKLQIG